jgi:hypothetical protein
MWGACPVVPIPNPIALNLTESSDEDGALVLCGRGGGDWDLVMKFGGMESKGSVKYKMELGGLWLAGSLESELFGEKFQGKSLDTYDAGKKKYIGVWADSMGTQPMLLEGTYDKEKKTLTMSGDGPGMDGKLTKYKSVSTFTDDDTINFSMYIGDVKDPSFTIVYKRKKK